MPPTLHSKIKMTSMSGEFYDTENASATPYLRKLQKSDKSYRCFKIFMENPENALKMGYHKPEGN
jgi:hypothetical protein